MDTLIDIDIDGVLLDSMGAFLRETSLGRVKDCTDYDLDKVFGKGTFLAFKKFIKDYSERIFPYPKAMESLARLSEKYQIQVCSTRDEEEQKLFEKQYHYPVISKHSLTKCYYEAILIDDYPPRNLLFAFRETYIIEHPWNQKVIYPSFNGSTKYWNSFKEVTKYLLEIDENYWMELKWVGSKNL